MTLNCGHPDDPNNTVADQARARTEALKVLEQTDPPERGILRAAWTYLLPGEVRVGLSTALNRVYDGLYDEGMRELEDTSLEALAAAVVADLEAVLRAAEEVSEGASASSLSEREVQVVAKVAELVERLRPCVQELREALADR